MWDTTKHLYKFDSGSLNYHVALVKITAFLSGSLIQDPSKESAGIWYRPYGFSDSERPNWVQLGEINVNGKTFFRRSIHEFVRLNVAVLWKYLLSNPCNKFNPRHEWSILP